MESSRPTFQSMPMAQYHSIGPARITRRRSKSEGNVLQNRGRIAPRSRSNVSGSNNHDNVNEQPTHVWTITKLEPVPRYYPLDKCSKKVSGDPNEITTRLSNYFRRHSIDAKYRGTRVFGVTLDLKVKFVISLWSCGDDEDDTTTLVEFQRLSCENSFEYYRLRKDLVRVLEDLPVEPRLPLRLPVPPHTEHDETANGDDAIQLCSSLLSSLQWDQQMLGLQSLLVLQNANIVGHAMASQTCKHVLHDATIQTALLNMLVPIQQEQQEEEDGYVSDSDVHCYCCDARDLRHLALASFAKALDHGGSCTIELWTRLYPTLKSFIQHAAHHPHEASFCAQILARTVPVSMEREELIQREMISALMEAHEFGAKNHAELEQWTQTVLDLL